LATEFTDGERWEERSVKSIAYSTVTVCPKNVVSHSEITNTIRHAASEIVEVDKMPFLSMANSQSALGYFQ
jgi:hypothetical protein